MTKYALATALWCGVAAYVVFAGLRTGAHRAALCVTQVRIEIADSTARGQLITREMVGDWLRESGMKIQGAPVSKVDLGALEELIARNGFVQRVRASIDYAGVLRIDVRQRRPLFRLLVDGYNLYVTREGFLFRAPRASSVYVPVVTGTYRPPFQPGWEGPLAKSLSADALRAHLRIKELEEEKYPYFIRERENDGNWRDLKKIRTSKRLFESDESFRRRVRELRERKAALRRSYRWEDICIEQGIASVEHKQERVRTDQKKSEKSYEDFSKLITFVQQIERDDFWASEVVQIVAFTASSGALEIELIPRSGSYTILFGRLERVDEKLELLERFYRKGIPRLGWERLKTVNVKYEGQVICTR